MEDPLVSQIQPHKLLLRSVPCDKLKTAVLEANTFNRKYWLEVAHVWMCEELKGVIPNTNQPLIDDSEEVRMTSEDLASLDKNKELHVQMFVAEQSYRVIDNFDYCVLSPAGKRAETFLKSMLVRIAEHCSFEKNNDAYLHALIKTKLPFRKTFILEPPFQAMNHYYHDEANSIVRPLMIRDGNATFEAIDFSSLSPDSLVSAVALLSEALDGKVPQVAVNTGIHRHSVVPFVLVGTACRWGDLVGLRDHNKLCVPSTEDETPITTIIYHWAKIFSPSLFTALTTPHTLKPGCGLYRFVN